MDRAFEKEDLCQSELLSLEDADPEARTPASLNPALSVCRVHS